MKLKNIIIPAILALGLLPSAAQAASFTDTRGHWAESIINKLADAEVVHGISDTEFNPGGTVTRAEFLKMAMGVVGIKDVSYRNGECLDLKGTEWYAPCIQSALDKGLIPEDMIEGYTAKTDENGVLYSGAFNAEKAIKREEMAYIAQAMYQYSLDEKTYNTLKPSQDLTFGDVRTISIWALDGVRHAYTNGLISGMDDGNFHPQATATRAQAATIINNILDK